MSLSVISPLWADTIQKTCDQIEQKQREDSRGGGTNLSPEAETQSSIFDPWKCRLPGLCVLRVTPIVL